MKKFILPTLIFASAFIYTDTQAQGRFQVNINIGTRPAWGLPGNAIGDYYYFPDIDVYYHIPQRQFVYLDAGHWTFAGNLPYAYRGYDLYRGYKVAINDPRPYMHAHVYRERYGRGGGYWAYRQPVVIRDRSYVCRDRDDRFDDRRYRRDDDRRGRWDRREREDDDDDDDE